MYARDSYDALAASIERVLRTDIAPPGSSAHLAVSIDRIMHDEACAGELRLGYLRLLVITPFLIATTFSLTHGSRAVDGTRVAPALIALTWLLLALALVVALRRGWYRRWVPRIAPVVDAALICAGIVLWWRAGMISSAVDDAPSTDLAMQAIGFAVVMCAFLSLSGVLRLSRQAARAGTALSAIVFLFVATVMRLDPLTACGIAIVLVGTGLLGASVTTLIRRVVTDEVARATLSRMYKDAEERIDAREEVLKIVSHDLRNPLHTISMCASLLLDVPMPSSDQGTHLQRIKRAGERMNRLIQDLLDAAKLEAGRVAIAARPIQVAPLMREAQEMLAPLAAEKGLSLDCKIAEPLPEVTADGGRVLQVLSNLVGNAIKFTPKGGRIVMRAEDAPGGVRFSVADTGPGIPEEQLTKLFGRFWQGNPADRRGIGLGLTISKGIVDAHGGRIWVESRVGEGTTFHFTLATTMPVAGDGVRDSRRGVATTGAV
jgi:signal transduction histidine kinase